MEKCNLARARARAVVVAVVVAVGALGLGAVPADAAANPNPGIVPISSAPDTYSRLAAEWWTWVLEAPAATNPQLDATGANCAVNQAGPVWFLAGTFGGAASRSCTVPAGKQLFFPMANLVWLGFPTDPPEQQTEAFIRAQVECIEGAAVSATIDGRPVQRPQSYLSKSVLFEVVLPDGNLLGVPEGFLIKPAVDEGYYLLLTALTPGRHTITFDSAPGTSPCAVDVHVQYDLLVAR
jgi:hypothetical protein